MAFSLHSMAVIRFLIMLIMLYVQGETSSTVIKPYSKEYEIRLVLDTYKNGAQLGLFIRGSNTTFFELDHCKAYFTALRWDSVCYPHVIEDS